MSKKFQHNVFHEGFQPNLSWTRHSLALVRPLLSPPFLSWFASGKVFSDIFRSTNFFTSPLDGPRLNGESSRIGHRWSPSGLRGPMKPHSPHNFYCWWSDFWISLCDWKPRSTEMCTCPMLLDGVMHLASKLISCFCNVTFSFAWWWQN
jgi:hypothetical protein